MAEEDDISLGHDGAGDDCFGKVIKYGGNGATGGNDSFVLWWALFWVAQL